MVNQDNKGFSGAMACDDRWVEYARKKEKDGKCEIGMHIHAWNSPPDYKLNMLYPGNPYITEYPDEIIDQKVKSLKDFLENRFETQILSNRSGRWASLFSFESYLFCPSLQ